MKLLYSNILPLGTSEEQQTISDCFKEQLEKADKLEIAVGYVSHASLGELEQLVFDDRIIFVFNHQADYETVNLQDLECSDINDITAPKRALKSNDFKALLF